MKWKRGFIIKLSQAAKAPIFHLCIKISKIAFLTYLLKDMSDNDVIQVMLNVVTWLVLMNQRWLELYFEEM